MSRLLQPAGCIGIALGRDGLTAAHGQARSGDMRIEWVQGEIGGDDPLVRDHEALYEKLRTLLGEITQRIGRAYVPVQVALPDPMVNVTVLELEALPKGGHAREELVRWHLAKHLHLEEHSLQVVFQALGADGEHQLLLGLGVEKELLAVVNAAFESVGMPVAVIDVAAGFRHNYLLPQINGGSGALVCVEPDYWTLSVWDDAGRLRHLRSCWREAAMDEMNERQRLAAEVERTTMAFVHGGAGRNVERLYVASLHEDVGQMCAVLDERTHDVCVPVRMPVVPTISAERGMLSLAAVASAQWRA